MPRRLCYILLPYALVAGLYDLQLHTVRRGDEGRPHQAVDRQRRPLQDLDAVSFELRQRPVETVDAERDVINHPPAG